MQETNYDGLTEAEFDHLLIEVASQHSMAYLMMQYPAVYEAVKGAMGHKALELWEQRNNAAHPLDALPITIENGNPWNALPVTVIDPNKPKKYQPRQKKHSDQRLLDGDKEQLIRGLDDYVVNDVIYNSSWSDDYHLHDSCSYDTDSNCDF